MKNHLGRLLLVLGITGLCAWAFVKKMPPLGLDLAGGSSLTYQATSAEGELTPDRLRRAIQVIENRLNATGVAEISITPTQANEIVVELPGRTPEQIRDIKELIQRNGRLQFRIEADSQTEMEQRKLEEESAGAVTEPPPEYEWAEWNPNKPPVRPKILLRTPEGPFKRQLERLKKKGVPETSEEWRTALKKYDDAVRDEVFTGDQLVKTDIVQQELQLVVAFEFKDERKPYFERFTEAHVKENMAILLDGYVDSAPVIQSTLPGRGIIQGGGGAGFTQKEARDLAIVLESGSTGINLKLSREESLGPSLGEVAIHRGMLSIIIGFGLVVLFMLFYYRLPGMVANLALLLNLVILLGVMAFFRAALTLPGIAGIVLTLGMAVDANILIFERFREERHRGRSVPEALAEGYDRALSAIIDSNVTTILTAVVLIAVGTGSVKGFGVSLTVGLLASLFTSILVTRWTFEWLIEKGLVKNLSLGKDKKTPTIDYMHNRKWFTGPSFVLMILGAVAYLSRSDYDKRDLEFVGGQEAIIHLAKATTPAEAERRARNVSAEEVAARPKPKTPEEKDLREKAEKTYEDASIVTLAPDTELNAPANQTNRFRIRAKAEDQRQGEWFLDHLQYAFGDLLLPEPFTDVKAEELKTGGVRATLAVHTLSDPGDPERLKAALVEKALTDVEVAKDPADPRTLKVTVTDASPRGSAETIKTRVAEAAKNVTPAIALSDPFPSKSFLEKSRAEDLYRSAVWAVILSLAIQLVYIRLRFANFNYGVAAVVALAHDVPIALGAVTIFDSMGLVYAKVNLVLIAAFLTLIGYSMNDTIVVFDRIRENLGRRKVVVSSAVNEAVNQTLVRSIRTSMTVWIVVLVQFLFSRGTGSVLEGFAFVMVVGVLSGTYSSIFIAAPLLLFLPLYWAKLGGRHGLLAAMTLATLVGAILLLTSPSGSARMWIGVPLAFCIPIHFLVYFFPWLMHRDPDEFAKHQVAEEEHERPLVKPGI